MLDGAREASGNAAMDAPPVQPAPTPSGAQGAEGAPPSPSAPAFDPTDHTVSEVLAYLERADVPERARVIDAERAGRARVTIVNLG